MLIQFGTHVGNCGRMDSHVRLVLTITQALQMRIQASPCSTFEHGCSIAAPAQGLGRDAFCFRCAYACALAYCVSQVPCDACATPLSRDIKRSLNRLCVYSYSLRSFHSATFPSLNPSPRLLTRLVPSTYPFLSSTLCYPASFSLLALFS